MSEETPKKSILFIIRYFHPFIGGTEKQALTLASALQHKGMHVEIITSRFSRHWHRRELIDGVPVLRLPSPPVKMVGALIFLLSLFFFLIKNRPRFDIIHAFQIGYTSAVSLLIGKILRKPTVLKLASSGSGGDVCRHRRTLWGRLFLLCCRFAEYTVVLNSKMRHELIKEKFKAEKLMFIPNAVNLKIFHRPDNKQELKEKMGIGYEKLVLYAGRLSREKGIDLLIHAFSRLPHSMLPALYILGNGPERLKLELLITKYHLENRIKILPGTHQVWLFFQIADVFVMPSHFEGLSNAVLEAMACEVPVIATNINGNAEVISNGIDGVLIERDFHSLRNAIADVLSNPKKARELGQRGREKVKKLYDVEKIAEKYIQLYENID